MKLNIPNPSLHHTTVLFPRSGPIIDASVSTRTCSQCVFCPARLCVCVCACGGFGGKQTIAKECACVWKHPFWGAVLPRYRSCRGDDTTTTCLVVWLLPRVREPFCVKVFSGFHFCVSCVCVCMCMECSFLVYHCMRVVTGVGPRVVFAYLCSTHWHRYQRCAGR